MKKLTEETRKVLPIGTLVSFGDPKQVPMHGKINAINIYKFNVTYEILYWFGPEFKTMVLREEDLVVNKKIDKIGIGFKDEK
jgi:hypothetical protein